MSLDEESIIYLIFLALSRRLLNPLCQTFWECSCEIYFLNIVSLLILAQDEKPIRPVVQATHQTHSADRVLIKVRLTEQIKQAVLLYIDHFQVCVDHSEVEPSFVWHFRVRILCISMDILRHNDLHLGHWEAGLLERGSELSEQDLLLIRILTLTLE